ncbi:MAG: inositol-3-phosphate synthase [Thermoplasmata archaeon]|nr:inositol-3-phosphate synthase [Thermoplasmata archaeon]
MGIKVAVSGVGNCASSIIQGVEYYGKLDTTESIPGIMRPVLDKYTIGDIEFVAAFDVNRDKVGKDLADAIFAEPNNTWKISDVAPKGVVVQKGPVLDGIGKELKNKIIVDDGQKPVDVAQVLRDSGAEMLINYLPVGSKEATIFYTEQCLEAGCAFVNAIPEFIASEESWSNRFKEKGLPIAGDDIKSQIGATIIHRVLADLILKRGAIIDESYQLNIGGNTDFLNMLESERLTSKRISKTEAVTSLIPYKVPIRVGPSDYVEFLGDQKICYINIGGRKFGNAPFKIDLKLSVEDSPDSAGVMIDVIRSVKIALDRGISGPLESISSYFFKHPPKQFPDSVCYNKVEDFISGKLDR